VASAQLHHGDGAAEARARAAREDEHVRAHGVGGAAGAFDAVTTTTAAATTDSSSSCCSSSSTSAPARSTNPAITISITLFAVIYSTHTIAADITMRE
jgi:hypothetical protein